MPADVASIRSAAAALTGPTAWPRISDEPVFEQPWEGRAFGLALDVVDQLDLSWEDFRRALMAAITDQPDRPYYESWVVALEQLVSERSAIDDGTLARYRRAAASYRYVEDGVGDIEVFPVASDEATLRQLLTDLMTSWWEVIRFGLVIQGAVYELRFDQRPRLGMLDGYLTIDGGHGHLHLCIGPHTGHPGRGVTPDVARRRRCQHAELYRLWLDGTPASWGFRMFNGDEHQQLTVLLPNPFLDADDQPVRTPSWGRLACWDEMRLTYLGLPADPLDRSGSRFRHG